MSVNLSEEDIKTIHELVGPNSSAWQVLKAFFAGKRSPNASNDATVGETLVTTPTTAPIQMNQEEVSVAEKREQMENSNPTAPPIGSLKNPMEVEKNGNAVVTPESTAGHEDELIPSTIVNPTSKIGRPKRKASHADAFESSSSAPSKKRGAISIPRKAVIAPDRKGPKDNTRKKAGGKSAKSEKFHSVFVQRYYKGMKVWFGLCGRVQEKTINGKTMFNFNDGEYVSLEDLVSGKEEKMTLVDAESCVNDKTTLYFHDSGADPNKHKWSKDEEGEVKKLVLEQLKHSHSSQVLSKIAKKQFKENKFG